jgi:hypothetical protein
MASGDQATGTPDYQLRRKVAIGMAGIEPATFCSQSRRATAALHPVVRFSRFVALNHPYSIALFRVRVKRENRTGRDGKPPTDGTAL